MSRPNLGRWRAFAAPGYRPFQLIAIGQACVVSFACDALFVPFLARLGAPPAFVLAVGSIPVGGAVLQALAPQILCRLGGNLRLLTLSLAIFEMRGFAHALVVVAFAAGWVNAPAAILLMSVVVAIGQTSGALSSSNIVLWTAVVLPEEERRLVSPRMGATTMALSTLFLLPTGIVLDAALSAFGVWSYAGLFFLGGLTGALIPLSVRKLPRPGRVLVRGGESVDEPLPEPFRRFTRAVALAAVGQGLIPYLSLYAIDVLHTTAGFAVFLSDAGFAGALIGSLSAGSFLLNGSSSRILRASMLGRAIAALMCSVALPGNPFALPLLIGGVALFNGAGNAGALAANERLYRLAAPEIRVRCQGYFMGVTSGAYCFGATVDVVALAFVNLLGPTVYSALLLSSGACRSIAGLMTDVSASWHSPAVPTVADQVVSAAPAGAASSEPG